MFLLSQEVKKYFLEPKNYCSVPLPPYFNFERALELAELKMDGEPLDKFCTLEELARVKNLNFELIYSKDGKYAWRTFQIIHPVIYLELVNTISKQENWSIIQERLRLFGMQPAVVCTSLMPGMRDPSVATASAILKWWHGMEQAEIEIALSYDYMAETDILECYGSMDLGLFELALDGPETSRNHTDVRVGRRLREILTAMNGGNPVGLAQGSVLMDFLAEIVFGYIDVKFFHAIKAEHRREDYKILRFRDDYKFFARDKETLQVLMRIFAQTLTKLGLKPNPSKTRFSDDVITTARKPDKVEWERRMLTFVGAEISISAQKYLLAVYQFAGEYPNSGSVQKALVKVYREKILPMKHRPRDVNALLSIVAGILVRCPKSAPACVAILSKLMSFNPGIPRRRLAEKILGKATAVMPNVDYLELCLQRLTAKNLPSKRYGNKLSALMYDPTGRIWNSDWLPFEIYDREVLKRKNIKKMPFVVPLEEVDVFQEYDGADDDDFEIFWK